MNEQNLQNLYYNLGQQVTGGKKYKPAYLQKDSTWVPMSEGEIINAGQRFTGTGAKRVSDVQQREESLEKLLEMQERGDTGSYGKNVKGFKRSIAATREFINRYQPEVQAWDYYQQNKDLATPIERQVTDMDYKLKGGAWERIPGKEPMVQGGNMMESTIATYLPEDIVSAYNVPEDDSLVASGANEEDTEIGRAMSKYINQ